MKKSRRSGGGAAEANANLERLASGAFPPEWWVDRTVVAAVSGGADSVALARVLASLRDRHAAEAPGRPIAGNLILAHFHHGLRGADADADLEFVAALAKELGCGFVCERAAAGDASPADALSAFSEGLGRNQRYDFLLRAGRSCGARYVAVGHTADDQAETILHHILRGTGLDGLCGMPAARDLGELTLVRPFLSASRAAVRGYLTSQNLPFREDATNADPRFLRNRIRNELLPLLERDYRPDVQGALLRLAAAAADAHELLEEVAEPLWTAVQQVDSASGAESETGNALRLDRRALAQQPQAAVLHLLREAWKRMGWNAAETRRKHWLRLRELLVGRDPGPTGRPGGAAAWKIDLPGGIRAEADSRFVRLRPRPPAEPPTDD